MNPTAIKTHQQPDIEHVKTGVYSDERTYLQAWKIFERLSAKVPSFWKTKKTSLQILKEERTS